MTELEQLQQEITRLKEETRNLAKEKNEQIQQLTAQLQTVQKELQQNIDLAQKTSEIAIPRNSLKIFSESIVFGKNDRGELVNGTRDNDFVDKTFTPPDATNIIGAWWSLQSVEISILDNGFINQFSITGTNNNPTVTINGTSATFRIAKKDNRKGLIRVLFYVIYI